MCAPREAAVLAADFTDLIFADRRDVLSVFLDTDPSKPENQGAAPAYRIWLRKSIRELLDALPAPERRAAREHADRVVSHLETLRPGGRGLALVAGENLWREAAIPVPLPNRVHYGRPDLIPILWAIDDYEPYAILAVDREHARIYTAFLGESAVVSEETLDLDTRDWRFKTGRPPTSTRMAGTGVARGAQRDTFDARVEAHIRRFWSGAAQSVARLLDERRIERLIIGGPDAAAHAVRDLLPAAAQATVVALVPLPARATPAEVLERTLPVALAEERRRDEALVTAVLRGASSRSGGVVGLVATLEALEQGQARTVVAARGIEGTVHRCGQCDRVTARPIDGCPGCGGRAEAIAVPQILPLLARRGGADLELLDDSVAAGLRPHDGIGALLRYATMPGA
jgi:hypothetical protein